jgi:hypothetical protein
MPLLSLRGSSVNVMYVRLNYLSTICREMHPHIVKKPIAAKFMNKSDPKPHPLE